MECTWWFVAFASAYLACVEDAVIPELVYIHLPSTFLIARPVLDVAICCCCAIVSWYLAWVAVIILEMFVAIIAELIGIRLFRTLYAIIASKKPSPRKAANLASSFRGKAAACNIPVIECPSSAKLCIILTNITKTSFAWCIAPITKSLIISPIFVISTEPSAIFLINKPSTISTIPCISIANWFR